MINFRIINLLIFVFVLGPVFKSCQIDLDSQSGNEFILKGKTHKIKDSTVLYLIDGLTEETLDSTFIVNNEFKFSGIIETSPKDVLLNIKDLSEYKYVWIENGEMIIDASQTKLVEGKTSGSKTQEEAEILFSKIISVGEYEQQILLIQFIESHPNSIVSAEILSINSEEWGKPKVSELYNRLSAQNQQTIYGKQIAKYIEFNANPRIGDKFVDFEMSNLLGEVQTLSDRMGKVTLLDFWASNCGPCRKEHPNLLKTYEEFNKDGFEIFSVSLDTKKERWEGAIEADGLTHWNNVSDLDRKNTAALIYGVTIIPDNFLIDQNGVIVAMNLRGEELFDKLGELLRK